MKKSGQPTTATAYVPRDAARLTAVALGREKADLAVVNANLLNVYTGEIQADQGVCVCGPWIAYVGPRARDAVGPQTQVIDAGGRTLIPGLIDGHMHLGWMYTAAEFLKIAMTGGTTTVVTETLEAYPVAGYDGVVDLMASFQDQPVKIFMLAPAMVSISRTARRMPLDHLESLLRRSDVLGIGESYWQGVLQDPELMLPRLDKGLALGKCLEGHSAGASEKKLNAYIAAGISSCHEPIKAGEVLDRLRLGLHVMVREGGIRRDLEAIAPILSAGVDLRRMILVTDGVKPGELLQDGYLEHVVQKAVDCGFDPVNAVQMASLNVAEHFRLDHLIGGIAPGRYADMVLIPAPRIIRAEMVISSGRIIAENGRRRVEPRSHVFSAASRNTIHLPREISEQAFRIQAPDGAGSVRIRVIDMVTDLVTRGRVQEVPVLNGGIGADVERDLIKVAAVNRCDGAGRTFTGLLRGFGLCRGAFACSAAWDGADIIVAGVSEADMALAVNRIHALQGGAVICDQGTVVAELPLPIFGLMSDKAVQPLAQKLEVLQTALGERGVGFADAFLSLITLTGAAIPFVRICSEGLVDLKTGAALDLFAASEEEDNG